MIDRRNFCAGLLAVAGAGLGAVNPTQAGPKRYEPIQTDDGMYTQPWFLQSFLDLREDMEEAAGRGKRFAILWELRGCPYCKATHMVNFAEPRVHEYIRDHFDIVQLDIRGARTVTDVDGEELTEREIAQKYGVVFTPTVSFFPATLDGIAGKRGKAVESFRGTGYMKPDHFLKVFQYVGEGTDAKSSFDEFLSMQ